MALSERWSNEQGFDLTISEYPNVSLDSKRRFGVKKGNEINRSGFVGEYFLLQFNVISVFLEVSEVQDALNIS